MCRSVYRADLVPSRSSIDGFVPEEVTGAQYFSRHDVLQKDRNLGAVRSAKKRDGGDPQEWREIDDATKRAERHRHRQCSFPSFLLKQRPFRDRPRQT